MKNPNAEAIMSALLLAGMLGENEKPTNNPEEEKDLRAKAKELGEKLYQTYLGFKDAGFTDDQAFQIVLTVKR